MLTSPDKGDVKLAIEIIKSFESGEDKEEIIESIVSRIIYKNLDAASLIHRAFAYEGYRLEVYYWTMYNRLTLFASLDYYDNEEQVREKWAEYDKNKNK
jgi:hypothetical protein